MLFNSINFVIFFIVVASIFYMIPHKLRWIILLVSSLICYYKWNAWFVIILSIVVLTTWYLSLLIESCKKDHLKKQYLFVSIVVNLGILFIFKYFNFANETIQSLVNVAGFEYHISNLDILLPVGVSFYSFQAVAYTFDVYNKKIKPEHHLGHFAVFISFFPKLISGPIERGADFLPQIKQKVRFDINRINSGFQLFLWGVFKKVVIADRL